MNITQLIDRVSDVAYDCEIEDLHDAARILREAHAAGFITDDGKVRKVLGKFKHTNDGAIACEEGEAFCVADPHGDGPKVYKCRRSGNPTDYGCWWQIDDCDSESVIVLSVWSTREAAEAARGEK